MTNDNKPAHSKAEAELLAHHNGHGPMVATIGACVWCPPFIDGFPEIKPPHPYRGHGAPDAETAGIDLAELGLTAEQAYKIGRFNAGLIAEAEQRGGPALLAEVERLRNIEAAALDYYRSSGGVDDHNALMDAVRADLDQRNTRPYAEQPE